MRRPDSGASSSRRRATSAITSSARATWAIAASRADCGLAVRDGVADSAELGQRLRGSARNRQCECSQLRHPDLKSQNHLIENGISQVVLADELSLGLAPMIVRRLLDALRLAADRGAAVLLVEQHVAAAQLVIDRAVVLVRRGEVRLEADAARLAAEPDLIRDLYLSA